MSISESQRINYSKPLYNIEKPCAISEFHSREDEKKKIAEEKKLVHISYTRDIVRAWVLKKQ